jgi:hypothetical protein
MTIHYHGTPLTPRDQLWLMAGKNFCVSFANPSDADICLRIGQSVMWDNGAFSLHTRGKPVDRTAYYRWLEPRLGHPHWAVIPDVIDGDVEANAQLVKEWPFRRELAAPVWHLAEPLQVLLGFAQDFGRVCFGSSGAYWQVGSEAWGRRTDEAFNELARRGPLPWVHMLRGMAVAGKRWPFASVDSVNVARNFKDTDSCPEAMARVIDAVQCPIRWKTQPRQMDLIA